MGNNSKKLTREEIFAASTANKGWSKNQLEEWGVPFPPRKGWIERLIEGSQEPKPNVVGELCSADNILKAAIQALMKMGAVNEAEALDRLVVELVSSG